MKKYFATLILMTLTVIGSTVLQAAGGVALDHAPIDIYDKESVKRGAVAFAENCYSCHSAFFMRFNRIAKDMEMDEQLVRETMIFTRGKKGDPTKIGELMKVSMSDDFAKMHLVQLCRICHLLHVHVVLTGCIPICVHSMSIHTVRQG